MSIQNKEYRIKASGGDSCDQQARCATFSIDANTATEIVQLAALCKVHGLHKIEKFDYRAQFHQHDPVTAKTAAARAGEDNDIRTDGDVLVVQADSFSFLAEIRHTDLQVKTERLPISELVKHFDLGEQPAAPTAFGITEEDVESVLRAHSLQVANTNGASFESMAAGIFSSLNQAEIEKAALHGNDLDQQTVYAHQDIARQLRQLGVLEPLKDGTDTAVAPTMVVTGASRKTTLFALIRAFDFARIDGYEVESTEMVDGAYRLGWCGGDDAADFNDQPLEFVEGRDEFDIVDVEGEKFSIEFFGPRPYLTPADVGATGEADPKTGLIHETYVCSKADGVVEWGFCFKKPGSDDIEFDLVIDEGNASAVPEQRMQADYSRLAWAAKAISMASAAQAN